MDAKVEIVLQKIHFIERDIELQKNILSSISREEETELEQVVLKIAQLKEKVLELKASIREIDPAEYEKIVKLEKATEKFRVIAQGKTFAQVITLDHHGECTLQLKGGKQVECLVMAQDESGDWTILTIDGETAEYCADEVDRN